MNWLDVILTSLSMSVDAMTVNATNGLKEKDMKFIKMVLISLCFGLFQFVMPVIGYFIGSTFKDYITPAIPWIGFGLLTLLAIKSFIDWIKEYKEYKKDDKEEVEAKKISVPEILIQGVATSIDALCIGFVFMSYSVGNAMLTFAIIGVTTFALSLLTVLLAKLLAKFLARWAGLIASIVFLGVGIKILLEGLLK